MYTVAVSSAICTLLFSPPVRESDTLKYSVSSSSESSIILINIHDSLRLGVSVSVLADNLV